MKRAALLSVSDRSGLKELAQALSAKGFVLLATSGTGKELAAQGVAYTAIDHYTGHPEILDGRVKTLHPKIHGGILARREVPSHVDELTRSNIFSIDVVVVTLYPFGAGLEAGKSYQQMVELIDVGGPSMLRAAAKNHKDVLVVSDPSDYPTVLAQLEASADGAIGDLALRRRFAGKVFKLLSDYDAMVAGYLLGDSGEVEETVKMDLVRDRELRYGENPHQKAAFYRSRSKDSMYWEVLGGKELSYNNMLDVDAAIGILSVLGTSSPTVAILKHLNPCGVARAGTLAEAVVKAKRCDPRSHFGGIIACNGKMTREAAELVREDFAEIVVAPDYEDGALEALKTSKTLRIIRFDSGAAAAETKELRSVLGGYLIQERDRALSPVGEAEVVTTKQLDGRMKADLELAWAVAAHVKSNAIVLVNDGLVVGVGAGQMSRIDSVELALKKAEVHAHELRGAVCASDAFFPFSDSVLTLAKAGVAAIIAPRGAKRDEEVRAAAEESGVVLAFAADRHFRH